MFPAQYQTVGYIPAGTQVSDPANDPQLLSETESHYWFQFDTGSGMNDADPLMPGADHRADVHDVDRHVHRRAADLEETTEVQLVAEIYSQAEAAFGLNPTAGYDRSRSDVRRRRARRPAADHRESCQPVGGRRDLRRRYYDFLAIHRGRRRRQPKSRSG